MRYKRVLSAVVLSCVLILSTIESMESSSFQDTDCLLYEKVKKLQELFEVYHANTPQQSPSNQSGLWIVRIKMIQEKIESGGIRDEKVFSASIDSFIRELQNLVNPILRRKMSQATDRTAAYKSAHENHVGSRELVGSSEENAPSNNNVQESDEEPAEYEDVQMLPETKPYKEESLSDFNVLTQATLNGPQYAYWYRNLACGAGVGIAVGIGLYSYYKLSSDSLLRSLGIGLSVVGGATSLGLGIKYYWKK